MDAEKALVRKLKYQKFRNSPEGKVARRQAHLKGKYGMTQEEYSRLLKEQKGCCAICGSVCKTPQIDHCHKTGRVRGLLCGLCNAGLGCFRDDPSRMKLGIIYLTKWLALNARIEGGQLPRPAIVL